ncbi:kelch-like protein 13 [Ptychodera flava]|uniref:kelch-like protein 13 n=1 Tax=Ptychodera flava TaxID=63121 RepID=UPI003969DFDD
MASLQADISSEKYDTKKIIAPNYSNNILSGLNKLHCELLLHDVTLIAEGKQFESHRCVLAACSDYFKAMFTGGMKESVEREVELKGITAKGLQDVLQFVYEGEIELSMGNIQDILSTTTHLQVTPCINVCSRFLENEVEIDNCLLIYQMAQTFHLLSVQNVTYNFLMENFKEVSKLEEFLQLPFSDLQGFLSSNDICGCTELDLFEIAAEWIRHGGEDRLQYATQLMENIRFPLMKPFDLAHRVRTIDFMTEDANCMKLLLEAFTYQSMPFHQHLQQNTRTQLRTSEETLVTLGGYKGKPSEKMMAYCGQGKHVELTSMQMGVYYHNVTVMDGYLYCVGGQNVKDTAGKEAVSAAFRYDPRFNEWMKIASLQEPRCRFHLSALDGKLYAVGGKNARGQVNTVECYTPCENRWVCVAPLDEPRNAHAGSTFGHELFVSGGWSNGRYTDCLQCYSPATNTWETKSSMHTRRGWHGMCTVINMLYVMGGNHLNNNGDRVDVMTVEGYNPLTDQWAVLCSLMTPHSETILSVVNNKIYIAGGYSWNAQGKTDRIERYDPQTNKWEIVGQLQQKMNGLACCSLKLPKAITEIPEQQ